MKLTILCSILFLSLVAPFEPIASASPASLDGLINSIQKRHEANSRLTGNFTQIAYLKQHNRKNISTGRVYLKKPGKMRWEYKAPEEEVIVSDGKILWFYSPLDGQVIRRKLKDAVAPDSPYNFLMGKGDIRKIFDISPAKPEWGTETLIYLSLVPKKGESNVAKIIIGVNRENFQVEETDIMDHLGNSTRVIISAVDREGEIPDKTFNFIPPEDVEVIEDNRD